MEVDMAKLGFRYRETYKVLRVVVLLSIVGLAIELFFALISSSVIIYTDVVHWAVDSALEVISMITFYIVSKVYKRIRWNILALESLLLLAVSMIVVGFYMLFLADTIRSYTYGSGEPTTNNPYLAFVTVAGGVITLAIFVIERRAYRELRTEVLKLDTTHAIIDIVVSAIATIGIVITSLTKSFVIELAVVLFVLFAALQTLIDLVKEAAKSILGFEADPELKLKLLSRLSELNSEDVKIGEVELRKMGTFYVARINVYVDPSITIGEAHRLRKAINIMCREVLELIYHVDVIFYPKKKHDKHKIKHRRAKHYIGS